MGINKIMKVFIYVAFLCFISVGCSSAVQQEYTQHKVQKGETISSISRDFNVSKDIIYSLNPIVRDGLRENSVIILPTKDLIRSSGSKVDFKKHKVEKKETLFGISQQYGVSIENIKRYNKDLNIRELKTGEVIRIPVSGNVSVANPILKDDKSSNTYGKHTVKPKETVYGIARKYGITVTELKKLNPDIDENLSINTVLRVPSTSVTDTATIEDDRYDFYEVQKREGFYRLKVKLGLSEEEIINLNPFAKDGLREGMILKIPKKSSKITLSDNADKIDLERNIKFKNTKNIAILLPFKLNKINADAVQANENLIKDDGMLRVALDFYSGVMMAAEFAKEKGISINIDVYDTEASSSTISSIISSNNFEKIDAVIGPLTANNVDRAASELERSKIPVFSPLSNKDVRMYTNLFQTLPSNDMLEDSMIDYFVRNENGTNFILIVDSKRNAQKSKIVSALENVSVIETSGSGYLNGGDINSNLKDGMQNWVILESSSSVLVNNVVNNLAAKSASNNIRLFTLDKNDAFDYNQVSNANLAKLAFTFPSVNKTSGPDTRGAFFTSFKDKYSVTPNRYAIRGFDIMYDVLLRLGSAKDLYEATDTDFITEYVENKFRYSKNSDSGYQNNASYILKYNSNLDFEEVK